MRRGLPSLSIIIVALTVLVPTSAARSTDTRMQSAIAPRAAMLHVSPAGSGLALPGPFWMFHGLKPGGASIGVLRSSGQNS